MTKPAYKKAWYLKNRERILVKKRAHYHANREKYYLYRRNWRLNNPEKEKLHAYKYLLNPANYAGKLAAQKATRALANWAKEQILLIRIKQMAKLEMG